MKVCTSPSRSIEVKSYLLFETKPTFKSIHLKEEVKNMVICDLMMTRCTWYVVFASRSLRSLQA